MTTVKSDARVYHCLHVPEGISVRGRLHSPRAKIETFIARRGDVFWIDQEVIDRLYTDRDGNVSTFVALLDDPEGQRARWGIQVFSEGEWPEGEPIWDAQLRDIAWTIERRSMSDRAAQIVNPQQRQAAFDEITALMGSAPAPGVGILGI